MIFSNWAPVAHAHNPSDSGGRDQEDCGSKPARANSSTRLYFKNTHHKKMDGAVAQGVGPEFKPPVLREKKNLFLSMYMSSLIYIKWHDTDIVYVTILFHRN
jgi:hypothetical protein